MFRIWFFSAIIFSVLFFTSAGAEAEKQRIWFTPSARVVKQGDSLLLRIHSNSLISQGTVIVSDYKFTIFRDYSKKGFEYLSYIGIPRRMKLGKYPVRVFVNFKNKKRGKHFFKLRVKSGRFPTGKVTLSKKKKGLTSRTKTLSDENKLISKRFRTITRRRYFKKPFKKPATGRLSSVFGKRRTYNGRVTWSHSGVDIAAPLNTKIFAPNSGVVVLTKNFRIHGKTVMIDHGWGVVSIYNHMNKIWVKSGQWVNQGRTIGLMGTTGISTGSHVHWGLGLQNVRVNPLQWVGKSALYD